MPVATSTSQSRAAAVTDSNWAAMTSAALSGMDGGGTLRVSSRAEGPTGTIGTPIPASRRAKCSSGGAHTTACAPNSRSRNVSPASGSTSPCDPYVDNNTRAGQVTLFGRLRFRALILRHRRGLGRKPPGGLYLEHGREEALLALFHVGARADSRRRARRGRRGGHADGGQGSSWGPVPLSGRRSSCGRRPGRSGRSAPAPGTAAARGPRARRASPLRSCRRTGCRGRCGSR